MINPKFIHAPDLYVTDFLKLILKQPSPSVNPDTHQGSGIPLNSKEGLGSGTILEYSACKD